MFRLLSYTLPAKVSTLVRGGMELGLADDEVFAVRGDIVGMRKRHWGT